MARKINNIQFCVTKHISGFLGGSVGKESSHNAGDAGRCGFDLWIGKIPGEEHGNPLQYSCLGNAMDRGAWALQSIG